MDPFDEFEFKPITEGLGFHNKKNTTPIMNRDRDMQFIEETIQEKSNSSTFIVKNPLPRATAQEITKTAQLKKQESRTSETVDEILRTLNEKKKYDFKETTQSLKNTAAQVQLKASRFDLSAALLDMMLITAMFLTSMIILLAVTKIDLLSNLMNPDENGEIYLGIFGLFAVLTWVYLVANRMFLGSTPGEWVFDQQVGRDYEVGAAGYSMKVAVRSLFAIATGFILFPFLAIISGHDVLGKMTGTQLYKKV